MEQSYKEKYEHALAKAKEQYNYPCMRSCMGILEEIFPELAESEDEQVRKEIISALKNANYKGVYDKHLAWLEKQGDKCLVNFDEAEKEKYDFVSGQFIECRKSFNEFKEDNSYWLEYIGDDNYIGRSDNILNQKFHITPRQLFTLFTWQHRPKEDCNVNDEANAPTGYGKYVDECLNEAAKHFFSDGEDAYSVADLFYAGVRCGKSWLEKQTEQKPADKVEPKFKVGEWVTDDYGNLFQIVKIDNGWYYADDGDRVCFDVVHDYYHKWAIADAKDGDILTSIGFHSNCTFIFNGLDNWKFEEPNGNRVVATGYCCLTASADKMEFGIQGPDCIEVNTIKPATKIQRDLLFRKMKEAGYEWDVDTKELKRIEPKTKENKGNIEGISPNWSVEDEENFCSVYLDVKSARQNTVNSLSGELKEQEQKRMDEVISWLRSLKGRVFPKQEWSEDDEQHIDSLLKRLDALCRNKFERTRFAISEDRDWLKSLKERKGGKI